VYVCVCVCVVVLRSVTIHLINDERSTISAVERSLRVLRYLFITSAERSSNAVGNIQREFTDKNTSWLVQST
jgi:hypothetical protein